MVFRKYAHVMAHRCVKTNKYKKNCRDRKVTFLTISQLHANHEYFPM